MREKEKERAELTFEEAMSRLEEIVGLLEQGDVPLEESIKLFQEGIELSNYCGEKLNQAEKQMELFLHKNGRWEKSPLPDEEEKE